MDDVVIYVRLLDEGTDCRRSTRATELGAGLYRLLPTADYDPEDETWEFSPDSVVRVKQEGSGSEVVLLAVAP